MNEDAEQTRLPPEKPASDGRFQKGKSGNPKGKPKGALAKTTRFRQVLTTSLQDRAVAVLKRVIMQAEKGDKDSQKLVVSVLQPFIRREAEREGGYRKNRRPLINIIVSKTDGRGTPPIATRVIEHEG